MAQLLDIVVSERAEAEEAALELGLLFEGERGGEAPEGASSAGLTTVERTWAVDELVAYLSRSSMPHPTAVWALAQSHDERIVQPLIALVDRVGSDPAQARAAYNALTGIINSGLSSQWREQALRAVRSAASHAHGDVRELAAGYLRVQGLEE